MNNPMSNHNQVKPFDMEAALNQPVNQISGAKRGSKLAYVFKEGSLNLSFSRLQALWRCPREFYLKELEGIPDNFSGNLHTAFGSAWGAGIQELFRSGDLERACVFALAHWDYDAWDDPYRKIRNKSFGEVIQSLETFYHTQLPNISESWELAYINGKPAIELTFYIKVNEEFNYQGHIDLIMRNKIDGTLCAWEMKTSGILQQEANWGNSEQTLGYHTVLNHADSTQGLSASRTIYLTFQVNEADDRNANYGLQYFPYELPATAGIDFINQLLTDVTTIKLYEDVGYWPKRGNNCVRFGRVCEYYGTCDKFQTNKKIADLSAASKDFDNLPIEDVDFVFNLDDAVQNGTVQSKD